MKGTPLIHHLPVPVFFFLWVDNLLGALLRIKEVIRQRVESSEECGDVGMTKKLEDILKESAGERGPRRCLVAVCMSVVVPLGYLKPHV